MYSYIQGFYQQKVVILATNNLNSVRGTKLDQLQVLTFISSGDDILRLQEFLVDLAPSFGAEVPIRFSAVPKSPPPKEFLNNHPGMEAAYRTPADHVIVDRKDWMQARDILLGPGAPKLTK